MPHARVALALILLATLVPATNAQLAEQVCGPITLAPGSPEPVRAGERADVSIAVTNAGRFDATVTVAADLSTPGWSLVSANNQTLIVAAGQKGAMIFVALAEEGVAQAGNLNLAGEASCVPDGFPLACPQGSCEVQLQAETVVLQPAPPEGFRIPGLGIPPGYVIAGIALLGVAIGLPFVLKKRPAPGLAVTSPEPMKRVKAGRGTSFPLEFRNPGDAPLRLALQVASLPHGWSAMLPMPDIQLAAHETRSLWVMVRSPPDARAGDTADIDVLVSDAAHASRQRTVRMRAEVDESATDQG